MEFLTQKNDFSKAISLVGGVSVQKTNTMPILGNVLLEVGDEGSLKLVGTDLEVGISTQLPVTVKKTGSITVPSKKINEIIRELPEGNVEITVAKNNAVNIKAGKAYFKIMGLSKEDFPKLPEWNEDEAIELEQSIVKECLQLTSFAISLDETRYVLNGVLISVKGKKVTFIATDGRRLAYAERELKEKAKKDFEIIVPIKAINELNKQLGWDGTLKITPSQNQVVFSLNETFLVSRLIEGNFPNYEQVIPKAEKVKVKANREEFLKAVRRASLLTTPDSPAVKFDFVKGKIIVSSRSPNLGEAQEEFYADVQGGETVIGFNPQYVLDVLKNLDTDDIELSLTDSDKPGLFKTNGYMYVIMPMQLN